MIIGTKRLDEQPPFCAAELRELFVGFDNMAKQGIPPEVPAALPSGQLLRIAATLKLYHDLAKKVVEVEDGVEKPEDLTEKLSELRQEAQELLEAPPPVAKPTSPLVTPGR